MDNAVRKQILDEMMCFMGHRFFKLRTGQDDREIEFQKSYVAIIDAALALVMETRAASPNSPTIPTV